jgi:TonB family protein
MDQHLLANLLAWSAQVLLIVALGSLLPLLLRVEAPGVRHAYYRVLLLLCLALPWLQGRHGAATGDGTAAAGAVTSSVSAAAAGVPAVGAAPAALLPWLTILGALLVAGAVARLAWIVVGLVRLRRLRAAGHTVTPAPGAELAELEAAVGVWPEVRAVPGLTQPVTFGALRPVVLLPEGLTAQPTHVRRAVLCHELLHVRRRDWLWLLLEESVRAALWFHPGVWWLITRVQLTREEVVDAAAVRLTGSRRGYAEALAAFADGMPVAPAAAFGRRRHLLRRLRLIAREDGASSMRLAVSTALMTLLVALGGWLAMGAFPMTAAAQQELVLTEMGPLERQARPITPENPVPRRIYSQDPIYPVEAMGVGMRATVAQMITVDASGRVAEVRGLEERITGLTDPGAGQPAIQAAMRGIVESAARAERQWLFDPPVDPPVAIRVSFSFAPDEIRLTAFEAGSGSRLLLGGNTPVRVGRNGGSLLNSPPAPAAVPREVGTPAEPQSSRVPEANGLSGRPGQVAPGAATDAPGTPIRVGSGIRPPRKTRHVSPAYPTIAQSARIEGIVIAEAVIGPDGRVQDVRILRSIPLLDQAALDAVRQWEFEPTLLNGAAVPVIMTVTVQFTLTD